MKEIKRERFTVSLPGFIITPLRDAAENLGTSVPKTIELSVISDALCSAAFHKAAGRKEKEIDEFINVATRYVEGKSLDTAKKIDFVMKIIGKMMIEQGQGHGRK